MKKRESHKSKHSSHNVSNNSHLVEDRDIAYDFSIKAYKLFKEVVKSIVLFGSVPKKEININSDIDIVIIVDDATIKWDDELIGWYREELNKLMVREIYNRKIHINTVTLTAFWDEVKRGEPLTINVLRYGEALIDYGGFFEPLKALLAKGKIKPSPESIFVTMERAHTNLYQANIDVLSAVEKCYWAMVDISQSALMAMNVIPPSPEFISQLLTETFVKSNKINKKYVDWYEEIRRISKSITYGEVKRLPGEKVEDIRKKAEDYINMFTELTKVLIKDEKIVRVAFRQ